MSADRSTFDTIALEFEGPLAWITLNRPEASAWVGRVFAESGLPGRKIAADRKNIFYTVPAAEVQRWQAASEGVVAEWVKDVTAKGYDGKKLLEEAKALMK
jgi:enoyl-CoA hydratase/carnithine racemase